MRNKYGIYQLNIPSFTLSDEFGAFGGTDITDLLTEEQKEIIKKVGDGKLVLLNCPEIKTPNDVSVKDISVILYKTDGTLGFTFLDKSDNPRYCYLYEENGYCIFYT